MNFKNESLKNKKDCFLRNSLLECPTSESLSTAAQTKGIIKVETLTANFHNRTFFL